MVVSSFTNGKLSFEIIERVETMRGVEFLIVFSVAALYFAVVPWRVRTDEFMANAHTFQFQFKQRRFITASWQQAVGKFRAIVCLDTFNGIREFLNHVP